MIVSNIQGKYQPTNKPAAFYLREKVAGQQFGKLALEANLPSLKN